MIVVVAALASRPSIRQPRREHPNGLIPPVLSTRSERWLMPRSARTAWAEPARAMTGRGYEQGCSEEGRLDADSRALVRRKGGGAVPCSGGPAQARACLRKSRAAVVVSA